MKKLFLSLFVLGTFSWYVTIKNSGESSPLPNASLLPLTPSIIPENSPTPNIKKSPVSSLPTLKPTIAGRYHNGTFTGDSIDVYYGYVKVQANISGGRITDITILDYPNDRGHSIRINSYALPILKNEAISVQSASVDVVSGATATSIGFQKSLSTALAQAR